jgi:hypothetical protein
MPYNLCMSASQIARCNRVLSSDAQLSTTRITHHWNGRSSEEDVVLLSAEGILRTVAALRANPEDACNDINLEDLDLTLLSVLKHPEDCNMLFGICL